jgi:hypothetical protein
MSTKFNPLLAFLNFPKESLPTETYSTRMFPHECHLAGLTIKGDKILKKKGRFMKNTEKYKV